MDWILQELTNRPTVLLLTSSSNCMDLPFEIPGDRLLRGRVSYRILNPCIMSYCGPSIVGCATFYASWANTHPLKHRPHFVRRLVLPLPGAYECNERPVCAQLERTEAKSNVALWQFNQLLCNYWSSEHWIDITSFGGRESDYKILVRSSTIEQSTVVDILASWSWSNCMYIKTPLRNCAE